MNVSSMTLSARLESRIKPTWVSTLQDLKLMNASVGVAEARINELLTKLNADFVNIPERMSRHYLDDQPRQNQNESFAFTWAALYMTFRQNRFWPLTDDQIRRILPSWSHVVFDRHRVFYRELHNIFADCRTRAILTVLQKELQAATV
jgi:hypothetical protein